MSEESIKNENEQQENQETPETPEAVDTQAEAAEAPVPEEKQEPSPEALLAELNNKYLLLRADFDNYRKRMAREANETRERAKINVVSDFLPVFDFFTMAMEHAGQTDDLNALKQGMQMILAEFKRAFENLGLQEIPAEGKIFDPKLHEAAKTETSETVPEGVILKQWKAGYKIGERLVRPSMVVVSSGRPQEAAPEAAPEQKPQEAVAEAAVDAASDEKPVDAGEQADK